MNAIRKYYENIGGNTLETSASNIKNIYLKNILTENDVINKSVLEVGAGGSQFKEFLSSGVVIRIQALN